MAHDDHLRGELLYEDVFNELLGRHAGEIAVKDYEEHGVEAVVLHQAGLLLRWSERFYVALRPEHLHRVRLEGDGYAFDFQSLGFFQY